MKEKKFVLASLFTIIALLIICAATIIFVDPLFHYHKPLSTLQYQLCDERYQNDGILRNFSYNAIITGTSMQENYKTSEFDEYFGTHSVKTCFSGADPKEICDNINLALQRKSDVNTVFMGICDGWQMDYFNNYYSDFPEYLYDNNVFNDVSYLFNKSIILKYLGKNALLYTLKGNQTTSFDDYSNWDSSAVYGMKQTLTSYKKYWYKDASILSDNTMMTDDDYEFLKSNIEKNYIKMVQSNPNTTFYIYYNPFSILYFSFIRTEGNMEKTFEAWKYFAEQMTKFENVQLYCFYDETDMICNLDNYKDYLHHNTNINTQILQWISNDSHIITSDNYKSYFAGIEDFYRNYNYDAIFADSKNS